MKTFEEHAKKRALAKSADAKKATETGDRENETARAVATDFMTYVSKNHIRAEAVTQGSQVTITREGHSLVVTVKEVSPGEYQFDLEPKASSALHATFRGQGRSEDEMHDGVLDWLEK